MKLAQQILEFLIEETIMDTKTAFTVLGLEYGDYDGVDKAFKKMAMKHHPDRGGDVEMMKKLNQAKDALAGKSGTVSTKFDWGAMYAKHKMANAELLKQFDSEMKPIMGKPYEDYLQAVTGKKHSVSFTTSSSEYGAYLIAEYNNMEDKGSYFTVRFDLKWENKAGALSGPEQKQFEAYYEGFMFIGTKKFKLSAKRWKKIVFDATEFKKPEAVFPEAKIKKAMGSHAEKPLKRADVMTFMKVNFDARFNSDRSVDWGYLPLNGKWGEAKWALCIYRSTMMRQPVWNIKGLAHYSEPIGGYIMGKFARQSKYGLFMENRNFLEQIKELVKEAEKDAKKDDGVSNLNAYIDDYHKKSKEEK